YVWESVKTTKNSFGVFREYPCVPTHDPDSSVSLADQSNIVPPCGALGAETIPSRLSPSTLDPSMFGVLKNSTIFGIMNWMWSGSAMKSIGEVTKLVEFLKSPAFNKTDLVGFDVKSSTADFDKWLAGGAMGVSSELKDGWREIEVAIEVPDGRPRGESDPIPVFSVENA
ncbi:hypothetical protein C8J57DRAFT_1069054, partial [Mycena rebaudengoi]